MRRAAALGLAAAVLATPATAQTFQTMGAADMTCGAWVEQTTDPGGTLTIMAMSWVEGWLTRANLTATPDFLRGTDVHAVKAWIDNYCRANPLDNLAQATAHLEGALKARAAAGPS